MDSVIAVLIKKNMHQLCWDLDIRVHKPCNQTHIGCLSFASNVVTKIIVV